MSVNKLTVSSLVGLNELSLRDLSVTDITILDQIISNGNYVNNKGYMLTGEARVLFNSYDFDDYIMSGVYRITTMSEYTNAPNKNGVLAPSHGNLEVIRGYSDTCKQIYYPYGEYNYYVRSVWRIGLGEPLQKLEWKYVTLTLAS